MSDNISLKNIKNDHDILKNVLLGARDFKDNAFQFNIQRDILFDLEGNDEKQIASILKLFASNVEAMQKEILYEIYTSSEVEFMQSISKAYDGGTEIMKAYNIHDIAYTDLQVILGYNAISHDHFRKIQYRAQKIYYNDYMKYIIILSSTILVTFDTFKGLLCFTVCSLLYFLWIIQKILYTSIESTTKTMIDNASSDGYDQKFLSIRDKHIKIESYKEMVRMSLHKFIAEIYFDGAYIMSQNQKISMITICDIQNALFYSDDQELSKQQMLIILNLLDIKSLYHLLSNRGMARICSVILYIYKSYIPYILLIIVCVMIWLVKLSVIPLMLKTIVSQFIID